MTTPPRRKKGTPSKGSYFRLDPEVKARINEYSDRYGVPTWAIVEAAIRAGDPETWGLPKPGVQPTFDLRETPASLHSPRSHRDEELPLTG